MKTWIEGENGNRASVKKWGSEEAARESLKTLKNCSDCSDCYSCYSCYSCSDCYSCYSCKKELPPTPILLNIHKTVYLAASGDGALEMSEWHTCDTTHCRAGWVVFLAGEKGRVLEKRTSTLFAAMQIYKASDPKNHIPPVRFFDSSSITLREAAVAAEKCSRT